MQTENRLFDDLARVANGIAGTVAGLGREAQETFRQRNREWMGGGTAAEDMVSREEFEAVRAMAAAARDEVALLTARLEAIEAARGG